MQPSPGHLYRDIYSTLFESFLTCGISVWGAASGKKLEKLFTAQIYREKFIDKFKTYAGTRPFREQILTSKFYETKPSKPLFIRNSMLNLNSLYFYHLSYETFKIFKFKSSQSQFMLYTTSLHEMVKICS